MEFIDGAKKNEGLPSSGPEGPSDRVAGNRESLENNISQNNANVKKAL